MNSKINLNVEAETEEEVKIEKFLNLLHNSKEVEKFINSMKEEAEKRNVYKYRARIKDAKSAIRTYRISKKNIDEAHDYIGISFITNTEDEIYPIINDIKSMLPDAEHIDFVSEKMIYSPLVYIKLVPPLGYNIFAKERLIPNEHLVPIEIRICSKEAYISEQSAYYTVHKNDELNIPREEKNKLRDLVQHITYKYAILSIRDLTDRQRKIQQKQLERIIVENKEFLKEHNDILEDAIIDCGRLIYDCERELRQNM